MALALTLLIVGMTGGINYVVDPFSRRDQHSLELARLEINRNKNIPLWSVFSVGKISGEERKTAEVVILGDSRATLLTQREDKLEFRMTRVAGYSVLNLSLGGGSIRESLSFFDHQKNQLGGFPSLKKIVFTLPFNRICEPEKVDRIEQSAEMADNPLLYYLNGYVLKTSLVTLTKSGDSTGLARRKLTTADGDKALKAWTNIYQKYDAELARQRQVALREFVDLMSAKGVEVIFYQPPGGASGRKLMRQLGIEGIYDEFLQVTERIGRVENFADETEIGGEKFSYTIGDPIHHDQGVKILELILGGKRAID